METGALGELGYPLSSEGFGTLPDMPLGNFTSRTRPVTKTYEAETAP